MNESSSGSRLTTAGESSGHTGHMAHRTVTAGDVGLRQNLFRMEHLSMLRGGRGVADTGEKVR